MNYVYNMQLVIEKSDENLLIFFLKCTLNTVDLWLFVCYLLV
jgi:hypothetical protein